jgi:hypothetical protein
MEMTEQGTKLMTINALDKYGKQETAREKFDSFRKSGAEMLKDRPRLFK